MWNTFKYSLLTLIREKNVLMWSLLFPFIMATMFFAMFANLDESFDFKAIPIALVDDAGYRKADSFKAMIEEISEIGEDQVLDVTFVSGAEEAKELLQKQEVLGYYHLESDNDPQLFVAATGELDNGGTINQTILKDILDNYVRSCATIEGLSSENPLALTDPSVLAGLSSRHDYTQEISVTANESSGSVRYFYTLLGFMAIMGCNIAMIALVRTQANLSALGARRSVGATTRLKTLSATLAATWVIAFGGLLSAYCYMRFILSVDFGEQDFLCILATAVVSLVTTALGTFVGALPKIGEGAKSALLTALTCLLAFFAGLYGQASMNFADEVNRSAPVIQLLNPSRQIADLFYSLYYYDSLNPFFSGVGILLVMAIVLFATSTLFIRRQRYASI